MRQIIHNPNMPKERERKKREFHLNIDWDFLMFMSPFFILAVLLITAAIVGFIGSKQERENPPEAKIIELKNDRIIYEQNALNKNGSVNYQLITFMNNNGELQTIKGEVTTIDEDTDTPYIEYTKYKYSKDTIIVHAPIDTVEFGEAISGLD